VRQIVALVNGLPLLERPTALMCPTQTGNVLTSITLAFLAAPNGPTLAVGTQQLGVCAKLSFTIGGKPQPDLEAADAAQLLKIAGLHWRLTS
jgi:hypothetical protein